MRKSLFFICLLLMIWANVHTNAQGLGIYLGGKRIELHEGDSINFSNNDEGEVEVKVSKEGNIEVYKGDEMTFFGDLERYFLDVNNAMHKDYENRPDFFGYGSTMHIRDVLTADLYVTESGYNWFSPWAKNKNVGPRYVSTVALWQFYENAIDATNKLIGAIDGKKATDVQKEYLGVAYAFRAMLYLDIARMYEFLQNGDTKPYSNTGKNIEHLTVPIITEKTTPEELAQLTRANREEMKIFIQSDLDKAAAYLKKYERSSKLLPNLSCVYGLEARLNMWVENYPEAAKMARKAIEQSGATPLSASEMMSLEDGFNTAEASSWMWGAQPRKDDPVVLSSLCNWTSWMSNETTFGYAEAGPFVNITPSLYKEMHVDDIRKNLFKITGEEPHLLDDYNWNRLPQYASLKFRPYKGNISDYTVAGQSAYPLMRVEEMYFIEAEACAHTSVEEGIALLNAFMSKYRSANYNLSNDVLQEYVIREIVAQKRIELWGEGQSFFDYKRLDMPVNRTLEEDRKYISTSEQIASLQRPAWMNLSFPTRSTMKFKWNTFGQENPDPSGRYKVGGGTVGFGENDYSVQFTDGIVHELFNLNTPSEAVTVTASPIESEEGISIHDPFSQIADSTMGYQSCPLRIILNGSEASLPEQPLGFVIDGNQVLVKSTASGTFQNGLISFPKNSIVTTYGSEVKVVNSQILTEVRMPGNKTPYFNFMVDFHAGFYQSKVFSQNGIQYLHGYLYSMDEMDEVRIACVTQNQAEETLYRLKRESDYGVTVKDTGWVDIPMAEQQDNEITIVGVGIKNGSVIFSYTSNPIKYPDYTGFIDNANLAEDADGNKIVRCLYNFAPQVEKGYLALVEKYTSEEDVALMFDAGTIPSLVSVKVDQSTQFLPAQIPFPKRYAEYKLVAISTVGKKVVEVNSWTNYGTNPVYFEYPQRNLSVSLGTTEYNYATGAVDLKVNYNISDFPSAYIALVPDSLMTGDVWKILMNLPEKVKVTGNETEATLSVNNLDLNCQYTLVIAACDADGRIVKDVQSPINMQTFDIWTRWYSTKDEWVADGNSASDWPLSDSKSSQTCTYQYSNLFNKTETGMFICYRRSVTQPKGQFCIKNWGMGTDFVIEYDPQTSMCKVLPQYVMTNDTYGDINVSDVPHYGGFSYADYPCVYDKTKGVFTLYTIYYCSQGSFGHGNEYVTVDGIGGNAKSAPSLQRRSSQIRKDVKPHFFPKGPAVSSANTGLQEIQNGEVK